MNKFVTFSVEENEQDSCERILENLRLVGSSFYKGWNSLVCVGAGVSGESVERLSRAADCIVFVNSSGDYIDLEMIASMFKENTQACVARKSNSLINVKEQEMMSTWEQSSFESCAIQDESIVWGLKSSLPENAIFDLKEMYSSRSVNLITAYNQFRAKHNNLFMS